MLLRYQWHAFSIACGAIAAVLMLRIWSLWPIYVSSEERERVQAVVEGVAVSEGWLLSDVDLRSVGIKGVKIVHRSHLRGRDPRQCYVVNIFNGQYRTCREP